MECVGINIVENWLLITISVFYDNKPANYKTSHACTMCVISWPTR
jgi:hypothetical protein